MDDAKTKTRGYKGGVLARVVAGGLVSDVLVVCLCVGVYAFVHWAISVPWDPVGDYFLMSLGGICLDSSSPGDKAMFASFVPDIVFLYLFSTTIDRFVRGPAPYVLTRDARRTVIFAKQAGRMTLLSFAYSFGAGIVGVAMVCLNPELASATVSQRELGALAVQLAALKGLEMTFLLVAINVFTMLEESLAGYLVMCGSYVAMKATMALAPIPAFLWKLIPVAQAMPFMHEDVQVPMEILSGGAFVHSAPGLTFTWSFAWLLVACAVAVIAGCAIFSRKDVL